MRNILIISLAIFIASCGNTPATSEAISIPAAPVVKTEKPAGKIDPVCEMPFDKAWTEQTIYNGDTITFCSETCKKAFLGRPTKYIKHS